MLTYVHEGRPLILTYVHEGRPLILTYVHLGRSLRIPGIPRINTFIAESVLYIYNHVILRTPLHVDVYEFVDRSYFIILVNIFVSQIYFIFLTAHNFYFNYISSKSDLLKLIRLP